MSFYAHCRQIAQYSVQKYILSSYTITKRSRESESYLLKAWSLVESYFILLGYLSKLQLQRSVKKQEKKALSCKYKQKITVLKDMARFHGHS